MKKVILIYILTITSIAALALFMNTPMAILPDVHFSKSLHTILEGTNSLLMFLIFLVANYFCSKSDDERLAILAGGFLIGTVWNIVHVVTATSFPFDLMSLENLQNKPGIIYLLFCNLILPLSIYFALTHKPSNLPLKKFRFKTYSRYFIIFVIFSALPILIHKFLPMWLPDLNLIVHLLEFITYSLYITLAFIVINIREAGKLKFFPTFTTGLIISGLAGLFYIDPSLLPLNGILAHTVQAIGLIFILFGIKKFVMYSKYLRYKDELVADLCLVLILFYIVFIVISSILLNITYPPVSGYIFIEFILIFQFIVYLIANEVVRPITNIIDALNNYSPGKDSINIPIIRNDEIGMLSEKINAAAALSRERIIEISKMALRDRSMVRIFESIRRISNPDIIKNSIIEEIKEAINPDRIYIALYNEAEDSFYYDKYIQNLPSKTLMEFKDKHQEEKMIKRLNWFLKTSLELCFSNVNDYISTNALAGTKREKVLRRYGIKSCCNIPIYKGGNLLGCLLIQFTREYITLDAIDVNYLKTMATQLGIVINNQHG